MRIPQLYKDVAAVFTTFFIVVFICCYPLFERRCGYCGKTTAFYSSITGQPVVAKESLLDRVINGYSGVQVYHLWCFQEVFDGAE